jgi:hypothetical protein
LGAGEAGIAVGIGTVVAATVHQVRAMHCAARLPFGQAEDSDPAATGPLIDRTEGLSARSAPTEIAAIAGAQ